VPNHNLTERRPVVAYVLDLFDREPVAVRAWRPTVYQFSFCGVPVPPDADAVRQWRMMRADTVEVSDA
jgi:hypothetical protein